MEVLDGGQLVFGESRVQEARAKVPLLPGRRAGISLGTCRRTSCDRRSALFELFHGIDNLGTCD